MKKQRTTDSNLINNKTFVKKAVSHPKPDTKVMDQLYYLDHCVDDLSLKVGENHVTSINSIAELRLLVKDHNNYLLALFLLGTFNIAVTIALMFK